MEQSPPDEPTEEVYQHRISRNGRENEHCVRVGVIRLVGTCSLERDVEEVGDEGMKQEG